MSLSTLVSEIESFVDDTGMSINQLSKLAGVPQSQLSDWVNKKRGVRYTRNARRVHEVILNYRKKDIPNNIKSAIHDVWDGNNANADAIANVIYSLKPLLK